MQLGNRTDVELPVGVAEAPAAYGSDLVVDLLRALGTRYVPLNPGSSFRGLHDSLVNHGGNRDPQLLLCVHEEIAVALAHGYAKGSGQVGVAAVHDLVGLMHASMAVYDAFCDRAPVLVLGGSGPADPAARRPIDWAHSATTQAELVRDFVTWDAEPATRRGLRDRRPAGAQPGAEQSTGPCLRLARRRSAGGAARPSGAAARPRRCTPLPRHPRRTPTAWNGRCCYSPRRARR